MRETRSVSPRPRPIQVNTSASFAHICSTLCDMRVCIVVVRVIALRSKQELQLCGTIVKSQSQDPFKR